MRLQTIDQDKQDRQRRVETGNSTLSAEEEGPVIAYGCYFIIFAGGSEIENFKDVYRLS